ncbi:TMAO reductase system periplasmic protein TorT [Shewanella sp. D64]|uniref:TMAO reductase system periplasmic protein TorT n=1 Tax=unclassified Shewanella TaxID=196818 RepID=UPI0022BA118E|nr:MULTISPECIES: TMAO reductase system periplasmic protein TorT [unclassified Shewanella]MEC4726402.1 TMAO reductase system periplasmic protein TorT [Shewanella sp. D64]MEC4738414.1 TMAO reductase system periplasmic protein TorT [Shewanella sp. E94]WBJ94183.1 TMAO reductase system periplasmic protein TorT [Shewanella sp. MTB7]
MSFFFTPHIYAQTWSLEQRSPFNVKIQTVNKLAYTPLIQTSKPWKICALVPHLKDAYWIGIDYGLVQQASKLKIELQLFEAGSYYEKNKQLNQLTKCMKGDFDAILLGAVDPQLLAYYHGPITKPVIALVNRIDSPSITTRVGVNWYQMGWNAGQFIKNNLSTVSKLNAGKKVNVSLLTGPEKLGGSDWVDQGILAALKDSRITISSIRHTDNSRNLYRDQLHHLLENQNPDYILGSAVAIEAAIGDIRMKKLETQVKLVSSYLSPGILRGLFRHKVAFSNDDLVVLQGKLAIDVIVKALEGELITGDIGPKIQQIVSKELNQHNIKNKLNISLAPADFYPIYNVD